MGAPFGNKNAAGKHSMTGLKKMSVGEHRKRRQRATLKGWVAHDKASKPFQPHEKSKAETAWNKAQSRHEKMRVKKITAHAKKRGRKI